MKKVIAVLQKIENFILAASFIVMTLSAFAQVVNRNLVGAGISWFGELTRYCMVCMALLGTEVGLRDGTQIAVTAVVDRFKGAPRELAAIFGKLVILTPTESAAVSVVYAFLVGVFLYRAIPLREAVSIVVVSAKSSAMILFIVATSTAFSWVFTMSGISGALVNGIKGMELSPLLFTLPVSLILLVFRVTPDEVQPVEVGSVENGVRSVQHHGEESNRHRRHARSRPRHGGGAARSRL